MPRFRFANDGDGICDGEVGGGGEPAGGRMALRVSAGTALGFERARQACAYDAIGGGRTESRTLAARNELAMSRRLGTAGEWTATPTGGVQSRRWSAWAGGSHFCGR